MKVNVEIDEVDIDKIVRKEMSILLVEAEGAWGASTTDDEQAALYKAAKLIKEYYS